MKYYDIDPRPAELGGGWRARLMDGAKEVGGGVFPPRESTEAEAAAWWDGLRDTERAWWIENHAQHFQGMATAAAAYAAFLRQEAYDQAANFAMEWLESQD
jgi:hypothetical protein